MCHLSVIIVNYNVKYYLEQCICSVLAAKKTFQIEIFVVDNNSEDDSVTYLRKRFPHTEFPELIFIENYDNIGFGKANNLALRQAKGEYILFLNPDTILAENTLEECISFARRQSQLGAIGVRMLKDNGSFAKESRRGLPTPWVALCKMTGLSSIFPRSKTFGKYYLSYQPNNQNQEIEIVSGAFMMVSRKGIELTHGFDPDFFMYGEDIDLSYRLVQNGLTNYYINTPIVHYKGESTHKNSFKYVHVFYEAMLIFFDKHFPKTSAWLRLPITLGIMLRALLTLIAREYKRLKKFIFPLDQLTKGRGLYIGSHHRQIEELANKWGLQIDTTTQLPTSTISDNYPLLIFDTKEFSFEFILNYLNTSTHKQYLGLFYPEKQILITGNKVYTKYR